MQVLAADIAYAGGPLGPARRPTYRRIGETSLA